MFRPAGSRLDTQKRAKTRKSTPRIIKLQVRREEPATFDVGGKKLRALHFRIHVKITGVAGAMAPLLGKPPPDGEIWILDGAVPLFLKFEGPLYSEGPVWQIEPLTAVEDPSEQH
jgi:hypothetical protein